jgi:hypothetical protein
MHKGPAFFAVHTRLHQNLFLEGRSRIEQKKENGFLLIGFSKTTFRSKNEDQQSNRKNLGWFSKVFLGGGGLKFGTE